ncbi:MAG: hypothetical protein ACI9R3_005746 [Verrucomicrobiales bacterium]|jgi:hypothetical protein
MPAMAGFPGAVSLIDIDHLPEASLGWRTELAR